MVSGNPYISVNNAMMKAENAPKLRQSRAVRGRLKLKAKMMKTAAFTTTSSQSPYAGGTAPITRLADRVRRDQCRRSAWCDRRGAANARAGRLGAAGKVVHRVRGQ